MGRLASSANLSSGKKRSVRTRFLARFQELEQLEWAKMRTPPITWCQLADRNELPSNHFDKIGRVDETIGTINGKIARRIEIFETDESLRI